MSTQRRENRTTPAIETDRADLRRRWLRRLRGARGNFGFCCRGRGSCASPASQRPRHVDRLVGMGFGCPVATKGRRRTTSVATNSLQSDHCFATFAGLESLSRFAAPRWRKASSGCQMPQATRRSSLPHIPFLARLHASPSHLAACPSRRTPLGGKVRWQKKFVFPARRMRRGLQFLKTINSRKSITNAKTNTPWRGPFTTAASPASCPACSRHLSTSAWSATPSCM